MKKSICRSRLMFHCPANPSCDTGELVVLVHGLFHNALYMLPMAKFLARHGYECFCYDYWTSRADVRGHAADFLGLLNTLPERKLNIVTHSLGGLVARQALADPAFPRERLKRVVMLAPPNRGSKVASFALKCVPGSHRLVKTLPELSFGDDSPVHQIPVPENIELGILAASHDILVPRCSTALDCRHDYRVMFSGHTYMMLRPKVKRQVLAFLQTGKFQPRGGREG